MRRSDLGENHGKADKMRYITPTLIAVIVALALIRKKAVYGDFTDGARGGLGLLADIFPPLGVLTDILSRYGADSFTGRLASVISGSTETTFYCLAVYLSKTRVKDIRRAIPCAVIGDAAGIAASLIALRVLGL